MKYLCSSLLFFCLMATGSRVVADNSPKSKSNDVAYPAEFVRQYNTECVQISLDKGLSEAEAQKLCDCTLEKFQSQYKLEEFKQLTDNSLQDEQAEGVLVEVGQVCFEQILYQQ